MYYYLFIIVETVNGLLFICYSRNSKCVIIYLLFIIVETVNVLLFIYYSRVSKWVIIYLYIQPNLI